MLTNDCFAVPSRCVRKAVKQYVGREMNITAYNLVFDEVNGLSKHFVQRCLHLIYYLPPSRAR
jgi:hypothetical protein